jgi:serine kinase of HPr protein (carbohydrate metabolism regulator)
MRDNQMKKKHITRIVNKDVRLLKIAGFLIKINFLKLDYKITKKNVIRMIDSFSKNFQIKPRNKRVKIDFTIDIKQTPISDYVFLDKANNAFVKLYKLSDNPDRITTFYSISSHQFQLILTQILFWLLADKGFILHCSAVKIDNQALIFLGKQGAGKSTVAGLLSDNYEILADDNGIIKKEKGKYYFYQVPRVEKNYRIKKNSKRYLIKAIFFLKKSSVYKVNKIKDKEFILKKMQCQLLGDLKNLKQKIKSLFKMVYTFNNFYFLFFGKDKKKLKRLIDNGHF